MEVDGEDFGVSESPLHILGYRVEATSDLSASASRRILSECFESPVPSAAPLASSASIAGRMPAAFGTHLDEQ